MLESAIDFLLKNQNADGGWGSVPGRGSNTESTSLSVLALKSTNRDLLEKSIQRGTHWLAERQKADGSWPLNAELNEGSWATATAVLALSHFADYQPRALKAAEWLLSQQGRGLPWLASLLIRLSIRKFEVDLNPDLKGWSWSSGTFSWVEPTAYSLIALKRIRRHLNTPKVSERIQQGELMLYDRVCADGGWNYGTPNVLGETAPPYPDITAVTLIALQDHAQASPNRTSLNALGKMLQQEQSGLSLSWAILCFSIYGLDIAEWKRALARSFEQTRFLGETKSTALSVLAFGNGAKYLRV
jgi:hypothetical protein